jgi:ATP-dependent helicase HrpB
MAKLRAAPRLAAMMVAAATPQEKALAADLSAILEERDMLRDGAADILLRLEALEGKGAPDRAILARVRQAAKIYRGRLGVAGSVAAAGDAGALLAAAFPDRIGQSRGADGSFRLSGGGSGQLPSPTDPLARRRLIVVAALDGRIRLAAALDAENLPVALQRGDAGAPAAGGAGVVRQDDSGGAGGNAGGAGEGAGGAAGIAGLERGGAKFDCAGGVDARD